MRRPTRDRLEYILYATIMTSASVALGLGVIFSTDEQGNRRKPIMNQPLDESFREARIELREYRAWKGKQVESWMVDHGYEKSYNAFLGQIYRVFGIGIGSGSQGRKRGDISSGNANNNTGNSDLYDGTNQK